MAIDELLASALRGRPDVEARRRLTSILEPGRGAIRGAALAQTVASAATAMSFYAVAAVAQDVLRRDSDWPRDRHWLVLLGCAAVIRAVATYAAGRLALDGASAVERRLRSELLARMLADGSPEWTSAARAGAVIDEVERVGRYAERYEPTRLAAAIVPLVLLLAVFPLNWFVGALLVLCAPLPAINLSIVGMGTAAVARAHADELRHLSGYFLDRLRGLGTLRALGAEQAELARVRRASDALRERAMAVLRVAFISAAVLEAIVTVAMAVVASYIGLTLLRYVDVPGLPRTMSLHTGLFLLMLTPLYFQPIRALAAAYHERAEAFAAVDALRPAMAGPSGPRTGEVKGAPVDRPPRIVVRALSATFPGREAPALRDVTLLIRPGELVGIAGHSGAGKSTLLRVLAGDLVPSGGEALIDDRPATEVARTAVTWLGQRPYLFPGTFAANIALGRTGIGIGEIWDAAINVGLGGVLARLEQGLDTVVGEGGWGLSGGETHRISLARTFLTHAPLLLLDEPTAHLDGESEAAIIEVITRLAREATTIVATHSPALLAACDRVFSLDRGALLAPRAASIASAVSV